MSNFIDTKYLNLISSNLEQFKQKSKSLWNFRCPFCGDSQKHKTKARGYVFPTKEYSHVYKCHNCGQSTSFANLLKHVNPTLHGEYIVEKFFNKNKKDNNPDKMEDKFQTDNSKLNSSKCLDALETIESLATDHPARKFLEDRKIPAEHFERLYYTEDFAKFVKEVQPEKELSGTEPRIIIPFFDKENRLIGFQGRTLITDSPAKYITIILDRKSNKIFGMERVDIDKQVIVVEGPLDSLFVNNSIAMAGSDLGSTEIAPDLTFCYDNEPRNEHIVSRMEKVINEGHRIVIFPSYIYEKDINDMVISGHNPQEIIENNTYQGLMAKTRLSEWRKA